MRIHFVSAVIAAALIAPSAALAQTGHVDLSYTDQTYDFGGFDFEAELTSLGGQVAFDSAPIGVQIDGRYTSWGGDADSDAWSLGGHVFTRGDRWLFGGYLGYEDIQDFNVELWTGALETQFYLPNATISGVLSHSIWDGPDYEVTMLEGEYRHFINDNFTLHAGLGFGEGDIGGTDPDVWSAALGGEYLFEGMPVSVFSQYRYNNMDFSGAELEVDSLSIGVRYNWGGTLRDRSRSGAGLNRVPTVFDRFVS
jgi:hypothetical protein